MDNINMVLVIGLLVGLLATAAEVMIALFVVFGIAVAIANMRLCKIS